ncbi:MAG: hypothetical protein ACX94B_04395 [Henriciella sp.]
MTEAYRLSFTACFSVGYAILLTLFFSARADSLAAGIEIFPYAVIGLSGLATLYFAPNKFAPQIETERRFGSIFGCGQRLSAAQMSAIVATGFAFGGILSKTVRALAA